MRLSTRDGVATVLVGAVVMAYVGYLVGGSGLFVHDARTMAAVALALGGTACAVGARPAATTKWVPLILPVITLIAGVSALLSRNGQALAVFIGGIVLLWAITTTRHARTRPVGSGTLPAHR